MRQAEDVNYHCELLMHPVRPNGAYMFAANDLLELHRWIEDQASLARLAVSSEVQAMHLELESLYRSQLICEIASARLSRYNVPAGDLKLAA